MTDEKPDGPMHDQVEDAPDGLFGAPAVLALVAFIAAILSLAGLGLMNGTNYIYPFLNGEPQKSRLVIGLLIGAALALIPAALGWRSASRMIQADPPWAAVLARASILLGLSSFVLRLVLAGIQASQDGPGGFSRL
jgi:hypothetical protein